MSRCAVSSSCPNPKINGSSCGAARTTSSLQLSAKSPLTRRGITNNAYISSSQAVNAEGTHPLPIQIPDVQGWPTPSSCGAIGVTAAGGFATRVAFVRPLARPRATASRAAPFDQLSPVPTARARRTREGLSLSLRARCLSVACRCSDVVVHIQGAQAVIPE